jgi:hypothetical protein
LEAVTPTDLPALARRCLVRLERVKGIEPSFGLLTAGFFDEAQHDFFHISVF